MDESSNICERCADIACFEFSTKITECQDFVPKTNADRIRSMSDEELAKFLMRPTRFIPKWKCYATCKHACEECVLEWLRKECDEKEM